ncbi:MAG: hypothetical protein KBC64_04825 [Simkaniaceae bacterium]|nr:hypothetical protein [Simkaniaceae bacterium]
MTFVPVASVYQDPHISCLLDMKPGDRFRNGEVISYQGASRLYTHSNDVWTLSTVPLLLVSLVTRVALAVWSVLNLIANWVRDVYEAYKITNKFTILHVSPTVDKNEFEKIYPKLQERVRELQGKLDSGAEDKLETFVEIKHLLKIYSKIRLSWAGKFLKQDSEHFKTFRTDLKRLRETAIPVVRAWAEEKPIHERINLKRWIEGSSFQRKFASWYDDNELPWMMDEIPKGVVLLDDPEMGAVGHWIQEHKLTPAQHFQRFKSQVAGAVTGLAVNHASLYLGDREIFHIDKTPGKQCSGLGTFDKYPKNPSKKERPLFRSRVMLPHITPDQADHIVDLARQKGTSMLASGVSILGAGFGKRERTPEYQYDLNKERLFACSSSIAHLYYEAGIDVGSGNNRKIEKFSPADYATSTMFHALTEKDMAAPDLSLLPDPEKAQIHHKVWELMGSPEPEEGETAEMIGEREAYRDVPRLQKAFFDVQKSFHINPAVLGTVD